MRASFSQSVLLILISSLASSLAFATDAIPNCVDKGNILPINDAQVLVWKTTTTNLWSAQAHVEGNVDRIYPDRNGHGHFSIQIGPNAADTLEVVYNQDFGTIPPVKVGQKIEACGVYITSTAAGQYPQSPDNAIIHWIHKNPKGSGHDDGFLAIDGILYGQGNGNGHGGGGLSGGNGSGNENFQPTQPSRRSSSRPSGQRHPAPSHH